MGDAAASVACVVVTHDALPWIERCLESVAGVDTVVVDNGSSDDTVAVVRERFPSVRVVEAENRGLAAGWNRGIAETSADHVLVLNADAWLVERRARTAPRRRAASSARRDRRARGSSTRTGRCSARCAAFRPPGGVSTEYLYLRKLAPRSRALNAFYGAGFDHASERVVDWVMGACMLVRRGAFERGRPVRRALLPLQRGGRLDATCGRSRLVGRLHPRRALRPRRRRLARRSALPRERPGQPPVPVAPRRGRARPSGRDGCCARRSSCAGGSTAASGGACTASRRGGSAPATSRRCSPNEAPVSPL